MKRVPLLSLLLIPACTQQEPRVADLARAVCPEPGLFAHAICVCEDLVQVGELRVVEGPAGIGSIGVNGRTDLVDDADVVGTWISWGGFTSTGTVLAESLITPNDVELVGDATISGELAVGGDLLAVGALEVGTLRLGGAEDITGDAVIGTRAELAPLGDAPPCGCEASTLFDVATAVLAAKQANDGESSWELIGEHEVTVQTGSYYVTAAELVGDVRFTIEGRVSIFVDGSLASVGSAQWQLAPGATLDLFVSGDVEQVGSLVAGDEAQPGAFRLYVGGASTVTVGEAVFVGSLYAPHADVVYVGETRIVGSVFARTLEAVGALTVAYGTPPTAPQSCVQPPAGDLK